MPPTPARPDLPKSYIELLERLRESATLASTVAALSWDQETMMPARGAELRAGQLALLSTLIHERRTAPRIGELLSACEADEQLSGDPRTAANLREIRRDYRRATLLPSALVRELAETGSLALEAWKDAREVSDFARFAPWLEKMFRLSRSKAECYQADSSGGDLYDALMEDYEPGLGAAEVERIFADLRARLTPLIGRLVEQGNPPDDGPLRVLLPIPRQQEFNRQVAARIGFALDAGRLDTSAHPFCQGIGPGDTRLTTRYREDGFADALSSTLHEGGHGLYEQGLPKAEHWGEPLGESVSLGIHESQSRLWENMVGRSLPFWEWALPEARATFGTALDGSSADAMFRAVNRVEPNLIRVESDEATYNLHIMLRFDLERALLTGDLPVSELPGAWNERIRTDLGLHVPDERRGCLQDVHWSMGLIGYFPTYALGNLYAAQLWDAIRGTLPQLDEQIRRGEFAPLREWLRENVHRYGRRFPAPELAARATGEPLRAEPFLRYLREKLFPIYGL